jgi:hypothetical protein
MRPLWTDHECLIPCGCPHQASTRLHRRRTPRPKRRNACGLMGCDAAFENGDLKVFGNGAMSVTPELRSARPDWAARFQGTRAAIYRTQARSTSQRAKLHSQVKVTQLKVVTDFSSFEIFRRRLRHCWQRRPRVGGGPRWIYFDRMVLHRRRGRDLD